jgi:hypothetical protein
MMGGPAEPPVGPRSRTERALAEIWRRTLELGRIGVRDDFFQLGGGSVAAAQVLVAVQREFGRSFPLAALFQAPTVAAMAELIELAGEPPTPSLVALQPAGTNPPFFCVHGVGGDALAFVALWAPSRRHLARLQTGDAGPQGEERVRSAEGLCRAALVVTVLGCVAAALTRALQLVLS